MNGMADLLEKKFGIHAVKDMYPIGWENTCKWILEIGRLHKNVEKAKVIIEEEKKRIDSYVNSILHITKVKRQSSVLAAVRTGIIRQIQFPPCGSWKCVLRR